MQTKAGKNVVTYNTPIDPETGFAEVGDEVSTLVLTIDPYGKIVNASMVAIENLPSIPITFSGLTSDVLNGAGESVPISSLFSAQDAINILGRLLVGKNGALRYTKTGDILIKKSA